MNSKAAYFFATLLLVNLTFAILLFLLSKLQHRKGLSYIYWSLFLKAVLSLGPALLMFSTDISWSAYLTGSVKVTLIPLTYLYFKKLSSQDKSLKKNDLWHFLPTAISIVLTLILVPGHAHEIIGHSNETLKSTMTMIWDNRIHHNILATTSRIISFGQAVLYAFLVYQLYVKYLRVIKNNNSSISHYNAIWIKWVVIIFLLQGFFEGFALLGIYQFNFLLILAFVYQLVFAFFFVIHASLQKDLSNIFINSTNETSPAIPSEEKSHFMQQFSEKELFLIPDISLEEVARKLNISKYELTQIIKEKGYSNFYNFINEHRIEKSKILLKEIPEDYVIESVIEQSGFNSRSTFYRVFKQTTGKTPGDFLNQQHNSNSLN